LAANDKGRLLDYCHNAVHPLGVHFWYCGLECHRTQSLLDILHLDCRGFGYPAAASMVKEEHGHITAKNHTKKEVLLSDF
jgi:hypothetical protein